MGYEGWSILVTGSIVAVLAVLYFHRPDTERSVHGHIAGRLRWPAKFSVWCERGPAQPGVEVVRVIGRAYPDGAYDALTRTQARELAEQLRVAAAFREEDASGPVGATSMFTVKRRVGKGWRYVEVEMARMRSEHGGARPFLVHLSPSVAREFATLLVSAAATSSDGGDRD